MGGLNVEVDPTEVGLDPAGLARLDEHFARYVDDGRLPGWLALVARDGQVAHLSTCGHRDIEAGAPVELDTLFRIYSMTKPITSLAAMMLYEEGAFQLTDPVSDYVPAFADLRVYQSGTARAPQTRPATEPMRLWHLMTHTSGLTYAMNRLHPVDEIYRHRGFENGMPPELDLAGCCAEFAAMPLMFDPGRHWHYSVATDVLGHVVEVVSGLSLPEFFQRRIFEPLGMTETGFAVSAAEARHRLSRLYVPDSGGRATPHRSPHAVDPGQAPSGGGGLVSTAHDYYRFMSMLRGRGELDGVRLLGDRTFRYMVRNHIPGGGDIESRAVNSFSEVRRAGQGFGLGMSVMLDPVTAKSIASPGEFGWGGLASTAFWIDPVEDLAVLFLTQLAPSDTHPIRPELHQLVHAALR